MSPKGRSPPIVSLITKTPEPRRASTRPSARSTAMASRITVRLTPNSSHSLASLGRRSPRPIFPSTMRERSSCDVL